MKLLIDIWHPSVYLILKKFASYLKSNGYELVWTVKPKDVTTSLLEHDLVSYHLLSKKRGRNKLALLTQLLEHTWNLYNITIDKQIDFLIGQSVSIAWVGKILNIPSINLVDDDDNIVPLFSSLAYPLSTTIICPQSIRYTRWGKKRILINSFNELAYLHPNNFRPQKNILKKYNLSPKNYILIRSSSLDAHHDKNVNGFNEDILSEVLSVINDYRIVTSIENADTTEIDPWDLHHILFFAIIVIADSQTVSAEAAVLGTPSIRYNSFVGKISYLEELEHKYGLSYGFRPGQEKEMLLKIKSLLSIIDLDSIWQEKRKKMLSDKVDLTEWMINYFEKNILN